MKRFGWVLILLVLLFRTGNACSCEIHSHARDFRAARAVFIGRVLEVSLNDSGDAEVRRFAPYKIKLAVEKSWMGNRSQITVISNNGGPGCGGFEFRQGERYLVYAFGKELQAWTSCTRTRPIDRMREDSQKELAQLGSFWFRWKARVWRF
jgi:hypothetical protein